MSVISMLVAHMLSPTILTCKGGNLQLMLGGIESARSAEKFFWSTQKIEFWGGDQCSPVFSK